MIAGALDGFDAGRSAKNSVRGEEILLLKEKHNRKQKQNAALPNVR